MDTNNTAATGQESTEGVVPTEVSSPETTTEVTEASQKTTDQPATETNNDSEVAKTPDSETESQSDPAKNSDKEDKDSTDEDSGKEDSEDEDEDSKKNPPFHKHPAWQRMMRKVRKEEAEKAQLKEVVLALIDKVNQSQLTKEDGTKEEIKAPDFNSTDFESIFDTEMTELTSTLAEKGTSLTPQQEEAISDLAWKYGTRDAKDPKKVLPLAASQAYDIYRDLVAQGKAKTETPQEAKSEAKETTEHAKKSVPNTKPSSGSTTGTPGKIDITIPKNASFHDIAAIAAKLL